MLYPTVGGGVTYAYGTASMAHPQLEAAGFRNVFDDVDERVFEVTIEELLGRNPDVLVLLHSDGDPAAVEKALTGLPGAGDLTAVRTGNVMTQLFNFTEPPTPLSIDGLERIVDGSAGLMIEASPSPGATAKPVIDGVSVDRAPRPGPRADRSQRQRQDHAAPAAATARCAARTGRSSSTGTAWPHCPPASAARRLAVVVQETGGETTLTVAEMVLLGRGPHLSTFQRTSAADHEIAAALPGPGRRRPSGRPAVRRALRRRAAAGAHRPGARPAGDPPAARRADQPPRHPLPARGPAAWYATSTPAPIVVLHDLNLAARYCDDLVLLGGGGVVGRRPRRARSSSPTILEPVYGIGIRRLDLDGAIHLLFQPNRPRHRHRRSVAAMTGSQDRINAYWTERAPATTSYQQRPERLDADRGMAAGSGPRALPAAPADVLDVGTGSGQVAGCWPASATGSPGSTSRRGHA